VAAKQAWSAFRDGLKEAGLIDGHNVAIEFRWAENKLDRLPALAADLVHRQVAVIVGQNIAMRAARATTQNSPETAFFADDNVGAPCRRAAIAARARRRATTSDPTGNAPHRVKVI
jgi:hypothetical protein